MPQERGSAGGGWGGVVSNITRSKRRWVDFIGSLLGKGLLNSEQLLFFRVTSDQDLLDISIPVSAKVDFEHAGTIF